MPIPDFIQALRAKVGTDLLQVPTASVMAYDDLGRLLLVQDLKSGLWAQPSGIIDPHELPSDAAVREVWEEAGVFVELTQVLGVFAGEHFSGVYPNGDQLSVVATVFAARVISGSGRLRSWRGLWRLCRGNGVLPTATTHSPRSLPRGFRLARNRERLRTVLFAGNPPPLLFPFPCHSSGCPSEPIHCLLQARHLAAGRRLAVACLPVVLLFFFLPTRSAAGPVPAA